AVALADAERGIAHAGAAAARTGLAAFAGLHRRRAAIGATIDGGAIDALAQRDGGFRKMFAGARVGATAETSQHQNREQAYPGHQSLLGDGARSGREPLRLCDPLQPQEQPPFQRSGRVVSRTLTARLLDRSNSAVGSTQDGSRGTRKSARQSLRGSTK